MEDIEHHMLHFNHDEQQLRAQNLELLKKEKPLMVVSTTISSSHNDLLWTEVGEAGNDDAGFGTHSQNFNF
jgi:hypothetical protein